MTSIKPCVPCCLGTALSLGLMASTPIGAVAEAQGLLQALGLNASKGSDSSSDKYKFADFDKTIEGAKKHEGLFTLYQKDNHLYAEIPPRMFNTELIAPMAIARGMAAAGTPLNFGDEWILYFRRVRDSIQLVRKNIHYQAPAGTPLEKAVKQNFTDSVLQALPIVSMSPGGAPLIDLAMSEHDNLRASSHDNLVFSTPG